MSAPLLIFTGCDSSLTRIPVQLSGQTMGTYFDIRFNEVPEGETKESILLKVEAELDRLNKLMSTWQSDSDLMQFNNSETTDWYPIHPEIELVVANALDISRLSGGTFDVTVGPLVEKWNFGVPQQDFHVPTEEELQTLSEYVGWELVETRRAEPALKKTNPHVFLNLSAIAKGYAVDRVGQVLEDTGIRNYLVNIGGEMVARGKKPDKDYWHVAIEKPSATSAAAPEVLKAIPLYNQALATSGNYRNYFEDADGNRYSHTLDPRTRKPVTHQLLSVSVIDKTCMRADALATALMVMGPDEAREFVGQHQLAIYLVYRDTEGGQIEWSSPQFKSATQNP
ncbi:MAG: FAD:protein FMN transferase [Planctomycetaceae bacterium]